MELKEIRERIDTIDEKLLALFLERMECSDAVAAYKQENGLPILNREREREILHNVMQCSGEWDVYAYRLFDMLLSLSKTRQGVCMTAPSAVREKIERAKLDADAVFPQTGIVAVQGVEGANAQAACDKMLPMGHILYVKTFEAVFEAVQSGQCSYGVVPIENSSNGSVRAVYELLRRYDFSIVRSTKLWIRHELLAKPGTKEEEIRTIYSHEQAIGQCSRFLAKLGAKVVPCENTAVAAKLVAESQEPCAAIASHVCTSLYGLETVRSDIQDSDNNYTRFICIQKKPAVFAGSDRISLILACENRAGSLHDILSVIRAHGVNMTKLESCPIMGSNFEFLFFLELEATVYDPAVVAMLAELERECESFTLLGNYSVV